MENEILQQILNEIREIKQDVSGLKQDVCGLKQDVCGLKQDVTRLEQRQSSMEVVLAEVKEQQLKDSQLLQTVFDQTIKLTEYQTMTDAKFEKIKSAL